MLAVERIPVKQIATPRRARDSAACRCGVVTTRGMSSASSAAGTATFSAVVAPAPGIIVSGAERYRPIAARTASTDGQRGSESVTRATDAVVVIDLCPGSEARVKASTGAYEVAL